MDAEKIEMVQSTWELVKPISDQAAQMFYARLFELDPELQDLFKVDMTDQGRKLMQTISVAVTSLTKLEAIVPAVQELGKRHVDYGVKDKDYDTVGEALLWTLGQGLGENFTDEVRDAWTETYLTLASLMKEAASASAAA